MASPVQMSAAGQSLTIQTKQARSVDSGQRRASLTARSASNITLGRRLARAMQSYLLI
jgi:hypothetical protein